MMKNKTKFKNGISLIELVLTIAVFSLVIGVAYSVFFVGVKSFDTSTNIGFAQQEARLPVDFINSDIRDAKQVYVTNPMTTLADNEFPLFSIGLKNIDGVNYLIKYEYSSKTDDTPDERKISAVEDLLFIPIVEQNSSGNDITNNKKIDITVKAIENYKNKEYIKIYNSTILFSNHQLGPIISYGFSVDTDGNVVIPTDEIKTLYYTKYN